MSPAATNNASVNSQELTRDMQKKMQDVKSMAFDSSLKLSMSQEGSEDKLDINLSLKGKADEQDEDNNSAEMDMGADISGSFMGIDAKSSGKLSMVILGADAYFNLSSLSLPAEFADQMERISPLMNTWYILEGAVDQAKATAESGAGSSIADAFASGNLTPAQKESVKKLVESSDFFTTSVNDGFVNVSGVSTYKVSAKLNRPGIVKFVQEMAKIQDEEMSASDVSDLEAGLKDIEFDGALFIGKDDHLLYRVTGSLTPTAGGEFAKTIGNFNLVIDVTMSSMNKDQGIKAPAGAVVFDESLLAAPAVDPVVEEY